MSWALKTRAAKELQDWTIVLYSNFLSDILDIAEKV